MKPKGKIVDQYFNVYGFDVAIRDTSTIEEIIEETENYIHMPNLEEESRALYLTMGIIYRQKKILKDYCK